MLTAWLGTPRRDDTDASKKAKVEQADGGLMGLGAYSDSDED